MTQVSVKPNGKVKQVKEVDVSAQQTAVRIPCEIYSRIVGYLRPVQNWHEGKRQEFSERRSFKIPKSIKNNNS